jgi:hypothetical protein
VIFRISYVLLHTGQMKEIERMSSNHLSKG